MIRLKNKNIIMLGSGGHAKVLIDIILSNKLRIDTNLTANTLQNRLMQEFMFN